MCRWISDSSSMFLVDRLCLFRNSLCRSTMYLQRRTLEMLLPAGPTCAPGPGFGASSAIGHGETRVVSDRHNIGLQKIKLEVYNTA